MNDDVLALFGFLQTADAHDVRAGVGGRLDEAQATLTALSQQGKIKPVFGERGRYRLAPPAERYEVTR